MDDKTEAERRFDELVSERRAKGRKTYGEDGLARLKEEAAGYAEANRE